MSIVTISKATDLVIVDGRAIGGLDLSSLAAGVRIVQWDGSTGHVEFEQAANSDYVLNETISDFTPYQPIVDLWQAAANAADAAKPATEVAAPTAAQLKSYTAMRRYRVESGGMTSATFGSIYTSRDARAEIARDIQNIDLGVVAEPVNFKLPSGWTPLTKAQFVAMMAEITAFVQNEFNKEQSIDAQIDAGQITQTAQIDALYT